MGREETSKRCGIEKYAVKWYHEKKVTDQTDQHKYSAQIVVKSFPVYPVR